MLTTEQRTAAADRLHRAERDRVPIGPLVELHPGMDAVDAYEVQLLNVRRREAAEEIVGHKVGLSSAAMQRMMGVSEPDYGHLLASMRLDEDRTVPIDDYCFPRVEVEVAFVLGEDLPGRDCTESDVLAATSAVAPALELIDSRIADWRISLPDTIADNASSAGYVLGRQRVDPAGLDLTAIDVTLHSGDRVERGRSDAVLDNPVTAVAWLARKVADFGVSLRAGHLVLPGSCTRAVDARAGDRFHAEFTGLGDVSLSFDRSES